MPAAWFAQVAGGDEPVEEQARAPESKAWHSRSRLWRLKRMTSTRFITQFLARRAIARPRAAEARREEDRLILDRQRLEPRIAP